MYPRTDYLEIASSRWQTPDETLRLKKGDCEDVCLLLMAMLRDEGIDSSMVVVCLPELDGYHTLVIVGDTLYDPSVDEIYDRAELKHREVSATLSIEEAFAVIPERR